MKKVLIDKNVNLKILKSFIQTKNFEYKLFTLAIENKVKKLTELSTNSIIGMGRLGSMRLGPGKDFEKISEIVWKVNLGDCMQVEAANFHEVDYFITEDQDILSRKEELANILKNTSIINLNEFLNKND